MTFQFRMTAILGLALLFSAGASAQEKIGYVDLQRALNDVSEGASAKKKLKKDFDGKQRSLNKDQEELKTMKENLEAQGMMMNEATKAKKMEELQRRLMEVQQKYMQMQQELSQKESELMAKIMKKMGVIVEQIGKSQGFTMILDRGAVLFAQSSGDITADVVAKYNAAYDANGNAK